MPSVIDIKSVLVKVKLCQKVSAICFLGTVDLVRSLYTFHNVIT